MKNKRKEQKEVPVAQRRDDSRVDSNPVRAGRYHSRISSKGILILGILLIFIPVNPAMIKQTGENIYHATRTFVPAVTGKIFGTIRTFASNEESSQNQVVIPLSNPGEPGRLNLQLVRGSIQVTGYDGEEVIIRYEGVSMFRNEERDEVRPNGLRRIGGGAPGFEAVENNNVVDIHHIPVLGKMDFDIFVPVNFSLNLSLVSGDTLSVENVNGELEISHVNGSVNLVDIGGSAVVNTVNGNIITEFRNVVRDKPMAFSTINGDIDVALPAETRFNARMKSDFGHMYTDFDMDVHREGSARSTGDIRMDASDAYRVSVHKWITAEVNGGGPEYRFNTLRGNIYIRSK